MSVKVIITENRIPQVQAKLRRDPGEIVKKAISRIAAIAKESMAEPKHGRLYRRGRVEHRASAPGEAPAIDTGNLVGSIRERMTAAAIGRVETSAEYAAPLEFGTPRMRARPFFRPAAEAVKDWFISELTRLLGGL